MCGMPYELWCAEQLGPEDASLAITRDGLDVREWQALRRMGISTTSALAELDPGDTEFSTSITRRSPANRQQAAKRLSAAATQARMVCDGVDFEPIRGVPAEVPRADVEIDFDIEWDTSGRIYQWGLRIREKQDERSARYQPVISFEPLDDAAELALAEQAAAHITQLRAEAERNGRTVAVYHWHHVEVSKTRKFPCMATALDGITCDLLTWFTQNFRVRREASIKAVAQLFGFTWAVDDPGGRLSRRIEIARIADPMPKLRASGVLATTSPMLQPRP